MEVKDERVEQLKTQEQRLRIASLEDVIKKAKSEKVRAEAERDREILLQGWTGWSIDIYNALRYTAL